MHVLATAGHVDHGKSALVRALTGMEPDRWAEERRRGLTIDLGFVWTDLPSGTTVAFVDVPGHERFVPTMLAGIGPVPAALFVVAADEGWMPQSGEHLAALHALGVRHAVLAVTRSDLADPSSAMGEARAELARTSLGEVDAVAVSAVTGTGLGELAEALDRLAAGLPAPDPDADVRLWIDRSFTIRGSGTVVTGTLAAGRLRVGDDLELPSLGRTCGVRGLQTLGRAVTEVTALARVAVNLRGVSTDELGRGDALTAPGRFLCTDVADVRVDGDAAETLPRTIMVHVGSAAVSARTRPLGADTVRLSLARALPLRIGDRGLLRDPGAHHVCGGLTVLDVSPPRLTGRGAAAARARALAGVDGRGDEQDELRRRGVVRRGDLERMGVTVTSRPLADDWLVDDAVREWARERMPRVVDDWLAAHPLEEGPPADVVRRSLDLPDRVLVRALVSPPLAMRDGRVVRDGGHDTLPEVVASAVATLRAELAQQPFAAPDAARLVTLGLGARELAAAERTGALLRIADGVVLAPESIDAAAAALGALPEPFTVSQARTAWGTTRRVAVPLLEHLDRAGVTRRLPDDRRRIGHSTPD